MMKRISKKMGEFLLILCLFATLCTVKGAAATTKVKMIGTGRTLYPSVVTIQYGSKQVVMPKTPAVLVSGYTMAPYVETLVKAGPKMKHSYNSRTGIVILKYKGMTVKLRLNSKTAYFNGKAVSLPAAPVKIQYAMSKSSRVCIPIESVSRMFGITYRFFAYRVTMTIPKLTSSSLYVNGSTQVSTYNTVKVICDDREISSNLPAVKINGTIMVPYNEFLVKSVLKMRHSYISSAGRLVLKYNGETLTINQNKLTAYFNGKKCRLDAKSFSAKYIVSGKTRFLVPLFDVCYYFNIGHHYDEEKNTVELTQVTEETEPEPNPEPESNPKSESNPETDPDKTDHAVNQPAEQTAKTKAAVFMNMSTTEFIAKMGPIVRADYLKTGVKASVTLAQAIEESGWGKSDLAQNANNLFGMKTYLSGNTWPGSSWDGVSSYQKENCIYRAYAGIEDSIADHSAYLKSAMNGGARRYEGLTRDKTYQQQLQIIRAGGYCEDDAYITRLSAIITRYGLDRWD